MEDYEVSGDLSDEAFVHYALLSECDPLTFEEAVKDIKWKQAMDEKIKSIEKKNTWDLSELPRGQKSIGVKWVYKTKVNKNGQVDKYKARLVAKRYKQQIGIDYNEVFALVARHDTIRLVLALATQSNWKILQMDVK
ncbi:uncharacterized mitochondrial protein AtMg00820-like [Benincasa hispida]|uniref:uncharacterized mitochondrial protein AtMg00820-like n=1 Tax=Benincasa hispida TaxID=102211 RepID=UPI0018FF2922|nr:uncharacterized mitochondrial protein AtMg00820-like [Benincasa hispida]